MLCLIKISVTEYKRWMNDIAYRDEDLIWLKKVRTSVSDKVNVSFICSTVERIAVDFFFGLACGDSPTTVDDIEFKVQYKI